MKLNAGRNINWKRWLITIIIILICVSNSIAVVTTQNVLDSDDKSPAIETEPAAAVVPRYSEKNVLQICPNMVHHVFDGATPRAKEKAGIFEEFEPTGSASDHEDGIDLRDCIAACCEKQQQNQTCNVVFVFKRKCYHVRCVSNDGCLPKERPQTKERLQMVLVNPVQQQQISEAGGVDNLPEVTWLDVLKAEKFGSEFFPNDDAITATNPNSLSFWKQSHKYRYPANLQVS